MRPIGESIRFDHDHTAAADARYRMFLRGATFQLTPQDWPMCVCPKCGSRPSRTEGIAGQPITCYCSYCGHHSPAEEWSEAAQQARLDYLYA